MVYSLLVYMYMNLVLVFITSSFKSTKLLNMCAYLVDIQWQCTAFRGEGTSEHHQTDTSSTEVPSVRKCVRDLRIYQNSYLSGKWIGKYIKVTWLETWMGHHSVYNYTEYTREVKKVWHNVVEMRFTRICHPSRLLILWKIGKRSQFAPCGRSIVTRN